jgi:hypothetical protein
MSTWAWVLILTFGLIKLPIGLLMLWVPFHCDESSVSLPQGEDEDAAGEDDGGSKTLPGSPRPDRPHPRMPLRGPRGPRRGPHGAPAPPSPPRSRPAHTRRIRAPRVDA